MTKQATQLMWIGGAGLALWWWNRNKPQRVARSAGDIARGAQAEVRDAWAEQETEIDWA